MIKIKFVDFYDGSDDFKRITTSILQDLFGEVQESDEPDFLFYSVAGFEHLQYDCVRIFWTGENLQPDFNVCDYAIGFSYMNYEDRYLRAPLYLFYQADYELAQKKHEISEAELRDKKGFCNFVYSNNKADQERRQIFDLLSEYKQVDSGGRYLNNIGGPVEDKLAFQKNYRFSIAFENASARGYTTEKLIQAFAAGTIPIYWGDPTAAEQFNDKAFVNCHAYESLQAVVDEIKRIDSDDELYMQYMKCSIEKDKLPDLEEYKNFLGHIVSQGKDAAYRRSNVLAGKKYQLRMKKMSELYISWKHKDDQKKKQILHRLIWKLKHR